MLYIDRLFLQWNEKCQPKRVTCVLVAAEGRTLKPWRHILLRLLLALLLPNSQCRGNAFSVGRAVDEIFSVKNDKRLHPALDAAARLLAALLVGRMLEPHRQLTDPILLFVTTVLWKWQPRRS